MFYVPIGMLPIFHRKYLTILSNLQTLLDINTFFWCNFVHNLIVIVDWYIYSFLAIFTFNKKHVSWHSLIINTTMSRKHQSTSIMTFKFYNLKTQFLFKSCHLTFSLSALKEHSSILFPDKRRHKVAINHL